MRGEVIDRFDVVTWTDAAAAMEDWRDLLVVLMFWFPPLLILILFLQVFYLYVWNEPIPAGPRVRDDDAPRRTLIVLGSGGHTAEMFAALAAFPPREYHPRTYVLGDTDVTSAAKVDAHEASVGDALAAEEGVTDDDLARWTDHSTRVVPRAREVSQSFVTSAFTTLRALWVALRVVRQEWPELILCNGPGTCLPVCVAAWALNVGHFTLGGRRDQARSIHWSPYDRVGVVNADP